jgi:hypothetical protein
LRQREIRGVAPRREDRSTPAWGQGRWVCAVRRVGAGAVLLIIALVIGACPVLAGTSTSSVSPALRAQARELYAPVNAYEHSTTPAERARPRAASMRVGKVIDACQAPYAKRLTQGLTVGKSPRYELYMLWSHATLLQTYQADVKPVATQLTQLAASWAALSLRTRVMDEFVHAVAAEFRATLGTPPFDSCGFVKAIAAHHFSYGWAKQSAYGVQAALWWKQISQAGDRTAAFWRYVYPNFGGPEPPNAGAHLFTKRELVVLPNLPGELG